MKSIASRSTPILIGLLLVLALGVAVTAKEPVAKWTQWGGQNQDFRAQATGLAKEWPESGPTQLWTREIGEGYSAILVEGDRLYTQHRVDGGEAIIAMDAATGKTVWETRYEASPGEGHVTQFGEGPRATPLLVGDRLFTIGVSGKMHCVNKGDGKVLWSHDLWADFGGNFLDHGYSSSPIAYKKHVIALVGGENASIVAFNMKDGSVAWKNQSFENSYSTPRILNIDGQDQLITFMATEVIGVDPDNGNLKWSFPHENQWKQNVNMPVVAGGNILFISSPHAGARGLQLTQNGDKTDVEEIWSTRKIQFYHVTSVQDGDWVYGSTGTMGPAFMAAVNIKTGEIGWRERGFAKANILGVDGKLLILDEDGNLGLATASPEGLNVHSRVELLDKVAWTVPTIVGKVAYLRDKGKIIAVDLG